MKRLVVLVALLLCLLPCPVRGEELTSGISEALDKLELEQLGEELAALGEPFASGSLRETLTKIAKGEWTLSLDALLRLISQRFLSALSGSLWRISRLLVPTLAWEYATPLARGTARDRLRRTCAFYWWLCLWCRTSLPMRSRPPQRWRR